MPRIFISYRRTPSSGQAGRLYDRLCKAFGEQNVFLDSDTIPAGESFDTFILRHIDQSNVFLALLAQGTLDRIQNDDDWVRKEIAYALSRPNLRIIPVLANGFEMPKADSLPEDVRDITKRNAVKLHDDMFDLMAQNLMEEIRRPMKTNHSNDDKMPLATILAAIIMGLAAIVAAIFTVMLSRDSETTSTPIPTTVQITIPAPTDEPASPTITFSPSPTQTTTMSPTPHPTLSANMISMSITQDQSEMIIRFSPPDIDLSIAPLRLQIGNTLLPLGSAFDWRLNGVEANLAIRPISTNDCLLLADSQNGIDRLISTIGDCRVYTAITTEIFETSEFMLFDANKPDLVTTCSIGNAICEYQFELE